MGKDARASTLLHENELLRETLETQRAEIGAIREQMHKLKAQQSQARVTHVVNNGNINTGTVNNIEVTLNVWGKEKVDHLTIDRVRTIVLDASRRLGGKSAPAEVLLRAVLSDIARAIWLEVPENRVAYLPNVKENRARVWTGQQWEERSGREVVEAMHEKTVDEANLKQPMETARDIEMMSPLLKEMEHAPVLVPELRATLVNMRPKSEAAAVAAAAAVKAAAAEETPTAGETQQAAAGSEAV